MKECIKDIYPGIGDGDYELIGPGGEIILPMLWENLIEPGLVIELQLKAKEPEPEPEHKERRRLYLEQDHYVPDKAYKVDVQLERRDGKDVSHFRHGHYRYEKERSEWQQKIRRHEGRDLECYVCTGKTTGEHFWTWTLHPNVVKSYKSKQSESAHGKSSNCKKRAR